MKLIRFVFNPIGVNTYIVYDPDTLECAIVDPGMLTDDELETFRRVVRERKLHPAHIVNTHLHLDHSFGDMAVAEEYSLPIKAHKADEFLGRSLTAQARSFGMNLDLKPVEISAYLTEGDELHIGSGVLKVIEVPGHTPGGIALYDEADGFVLTGDSLFQGSIGRTDLPGGNMTDLLKALRAKILTLPPKTVVYPGHGEPTTIAAELRSNPYF